MPVHEKHLSKEEQWNVWTHAVMAVVFALWMCISAGDAWQQDHVYGIGIFVFFVCMIAMFSASAFYHGM